VRRHLWDWLWDHVEVDAGVEQEMGQGSDGRPMSGLELDLDSFTGVRPVGPGSHQAAERPVPAGCSSMALRVGRVAGGAESRAPVIDRSVAMQATQSSRAGRGHYKADAGPPLGAVADGADPGDGRGDQDQLNASQPAAAKLAAGTT
jgi:hypothetical protein